jgi:hypothetical protein
MAITIPVMTTQGVLTPTSAQSSSIPSSPVTQSSSTKLQVGDVKINKMQMTAIDGSAQVGIVAQCETMVIIEDLFRPTMIADIHVVDGINLLKTFPIVGKEYIDISFQTPGESESFNCRMYVYAVTDVKIESENQKQRYTLKCCSQEFLLNLATTVEKGYLTTIDQMILDILKTNLKTSKPLNIYPTQGVQQIVMPRFTPFSGIDMLRCRASSLNRLSSSFVFFENKRGFNFLTIEDLFQSTTTPRQYYRKTALQVVLASEYAQWQIDDYNVNQQFNIMDAISTGAYQGLLESYEWSTKTLNPTTYLGSSFSEFENLGTSGGDSTRSVPNADLQLYSQDVGDRRYNISDATKPPTFIQQFLPNKFGFLAPNLTSAYDLYINGDSAVCCGDIIGINLVQVSGLTNKPATTADQLTNGNYLITKMKHIIMVSAKGTKYTAIPTVTRGTYE